MVKKVRRFAEINCTHDFELHFRTPRQNRPFRYIKIQLDSENWINMVIQFPLFVSSKRRYCQAEF